MLYYNTSEVYVTVFLHQDFINFQFGGKDFQKSLILETKQRNNSY